MMNKTFKSYIVEYKQGKKEVIQQLVEWKKKPEKNSKGKIDQVHNLVIHDKAVKGIFYRIREKHKTINAKEFQGWFYEGLVEVLELDQVDLSRSPNEVLSWFNKRISGHIHDKIGEEIPDYSLTVFDDVVSVNDDESEKTTTYLSDLEMFRQFWSVKTPSQYKEFLEYYGLTPKVLEEEKKNDLMTEYEMKLFKKSLNPDVKQRDIADELNIDQGNVSKKISKLNKKLKSKWLYFKSLKELEHKKFYDKINDYIAQYEMLQQYGVKEDRHYFDHLIKFLKENYTKGEQLDDSFGQSGTFEYLHSNKPNETVTIFDILVDGLTKTQYITLMNILELDSEEPIETSIKRDIHKKAYRVFSNYVGGFKASLKRYWEKAEISA